MAFVVLAGAVGAPAPCVRFSDPAAAVLLRSQWSRRGACIVTSDSFDVLWLSSEGGWPTPLQPHQRYNRVQGIERVANKYDLAALAAQGGWDFVPFSGSLAAARAHPAGEVPFSWLLKSAAHRGVTVLPRLPDASEGATSDRTFSLFQRRVPNQVLFGGRVFDLGVYALVVQERGGLRYQLHDDVLLRFCELPFVAASDASRLLTQDASAALLAMLQRSWIVGDAYMSAWDVPQLSEVLGSKVVGTSATATARPPGDVNLSSRSRDALAHMLGGGPLGEDRLRSLWERIDNVVHRTLGVAAVQPHVGGAAETTLRANFELVRFDFVLDARHMPFLIEVNAGPNLQPHSVGQERMLRGLADFILDFLQDAPQPQPQQVSSVQSQRTQLKPSPSLQLVRRAPSTHSGERLSLSLWQHVPARATGTAVSSIVRTRALSHEPWHSVTTPAVNDPPLPPFPPPSPPGVVAPPSPPFPPFPPSPPPAGAASDEDSAPIAVVVVIGAFLVLSTAAFLLIKRGQASAAGASSGPAKTCPVQGAL